MITATKRIFEEAVANARSQMNFQIQEFLSSSEQFASVSAE